MSQPTIAQPTVQPYLFFGGRCKEALDFYQAALDAKVGALVRFNESPTPPPPGQIPDGWGDKIMHSALRVGSALIMASDGCGEGAGCSGVSLALNVATEAEADRAFAALSDGGKVTMPLAKTFWSPRFGMLTDRFGVDWMVNVAPPA